jgi:tetraacyldisaccharide 4'-kinase
MAPTSYYPSDGDILLGPSEFRELVSGRRRGLWPTALRGVLRVVEWPYTWAVRVRNRRYDHGRVERVGVPVVSVGNITLGGTGKTPVVEWLARWFEQQQVRVGLVSRGYGAKAGQANDEALELARKLPNVPHVLDADRVRGARHAIAQFGCQLLVLDDAFQHRRIARDLDIVLIDATEPFGFGHVFPRGTLREPLEGLSRADVIILTRSEQLDDRDRAGIRDQVTAHAARAAWVEATYQPECLETCTGQRRELSSLEERRVAAFCGIGNPLGFRSALDRCHYQVIALREFADHFDYARRDIDDLQRWAERLEAEAVICTCKDLVKIQDRWRSAIPLVALSSKLQITAGLEKLESSLRPLASRALGSA